MGARVALGRGSWRLAVLAVMVLTPLVVNQMGFGDYLNNVNLVVAYGLIGLAQTLCLGIAGRVHFGIVGFAVVGAYAYSYASQNWGWSPFLCAAFAAAAGAVVSAITSLALLRLEGFYLGVATLGLWFVAQNIAANLQIVGGRNGMTASPLVADPVTQSMIFTAIFAIVLLVSHSVVASRKGRETFAMNDDAEAVRGFGLSTLSYTYVIFIIAGALGGFAGALLAADIGFIAPDTFGLNLLVLILAVSVIGGVRSVWGAVAGAIIVEVLAQTTSEHPDTSEMLYGLGFLLIILILPAGVVGLVTDIRTRLSRRAATRRSTAAPPPPTSTAAPPTTPVVAQPDAAAPPDAKFEEQRS